MSDQVHGHAPSEAQQSFARAPAGEPEFVASFRRALALPAPVEAREHDAIVDASELRALLIRNKVLKPRAEDRSAGEV